ncbi:MAG: cysteine-rich KTR domain-containing protein [Lawsonibacter sp.]
MSKTVGALRCKVTTGAAWVMCPVCRCGKLLKLTEETRAQGLVLFCRRCKHESVVEIGPGDSGGNCLPRVWETAGGAGACLPIAHG